MRLFEYLKTAFSNQWNLLAFGAASGFALLSGRADIFMPLVLAAECAYVSLLGTHPKFQKYVEAQAAARQRGANGQTSGDALQQILTGLPPATLARFERLRTRCLELRQIAGDLSRTRGDAPGMPLDSFQIEGLDKLLWIFIRLLFTQHSLAKFLGSSGYSVAGFELAGVKAMRKDIEQLEQRLQKLDPDDQSPHAQKMKRTLEDHLQTCRDRVANFEKAQANHELVGLEIDRLENKITTLAELSVNRQDPDFIAGQVDQVASSMLEMEKTMNDLQFATGLGPLEEDVPELMQNPPTEKVSA